jgi:hypothetical protein
MALVALSRHCCRKSCAQIGADINTPITANPALITPTSSAIDLAQSN